MSPRYTDHRGASRARKAYAAAVMARVEAKADAQAAHRIAVAERRERASRRRYLEALRLSELEA